MQIEEGIIPIEVKSGTTGHSDPNPNHIKVLSDVLERRRAAQGAQIPTISEVLLSLPEARVSVLDAYNACKKITRILANFSLFPHIK